MPKWQPTRVQMDICPLACACFSIGANVVFIFVTDEKRHHFGTFVKKFYEVQIAFFRPICKLSKA
jgi:hypothetical protein